MSLASQLASRDVIDDGGKNISIAVEGGEIGRFITYHKTGTVMARNVKLECLKDEPVAFMGHGEWSVESKKVHFVRDPVAMVVSAYLYHRTSGENWLSVPDKHFGWVNRSRATAHYYVKGESYQGFLNRVPQSVGVQAEFQRSSTVLELMLEQAWMCSTRPFNCKQVCLEAFTASSEGYNETWREILDFLHVPAHYLDCISLYDLLNPHYAGKMADHGTSTSAEELAKMTQEVLELDQVQLNGMLSKGAASLDCDKISNLFQTTSSSDRRRIIEAYA